MIEVIILHKETQTELARLEIENVTPGDGEYADYSVQLGVEKGRSVGVHQRGIFGFPRKQYNVLALVLQALNSLDPRDLQFDGEWDLRPKMTKAIKKGKIWWL